MGETRADVRVCRDDLRLLRAIARRVRAAIAYRWLDGAIVVTAPTGTHWFSSTFADHRHDPPGALSLLEWPRLGAGLYFDGVHLVGRDVPATALPERGTPLRDLVSQQLFVRSSGLIPLDRATLRARPPGTWALLRDRAAVLAGWLGLAALPTLLLLSFELAFIGRRRALRRALAGSVSGADGRFVFLPARAQARPHPLRPRELATLDEVTIALEGPVPCVLVGVAYQREVPAPSYRESALVHELRGRVLLGPRRAHLGALAASHARMAPSVRLLLGVGAAASLVPALVFLHAAMRL
ncbi:MAG: hypothetical protein AAGH15_11255 [Myxococcota bacterium]